MKGLVYKIYTIPEKFHNFILPTNQKVPSNWRIIKEKITEILAIGKFEIFASESEAKLYHDQKNILEENWIISN
jgi:hypothetical protein